MTTSGEIKRHPIRGALWGLLLGFGATGLLIMFSVIAVGTLTPWFVLLAFIVLGALWGAFGPAKRTRDLPPSRVRAVPTATTAPGKTSQDAAASGEEAAEIAADPVSAAGETAEAEAKDAGADDSTSGPEAEAEGGDGEKA